MEQGRTPYAIRLSEKQFSVTEDPETGVELRFWPLYAAFCVGE